MTYKGFYSNKEFTADEIMERWRAWKNKTWEGKYSPEEVEDSINIVNARILNSLDRILK